MAVDSSAVLAAAARALRAKAGLELDAGSAQRLPSSDRNALWRVRLTGATEPATAVVKAYFDADPLTGSATGWARESAALATLASTRVVGPALLAASREAQLVVMADAGSGPSIADELLTGDAASAGAGLLGWATALAETHAATAGCGDVFAAELGAAAGPDDEAATDTMPLALARSVDRLLEPLARIGVSPSSAALADVRSLAELLPPAPGAAALTPGDACPDNNVVAGGRVTLIDYESAEYRHVAWDVAYLVVPWPSCWCSWRMPEEAAAAALARYRERAAPALPRVATPAFDGDLAVAVAGWAFVSAGWFLPNAFTDPPPSDPRIVTPSRRAVLQHRFALAAGMGDPVPASVTALAAECAAAIAAQWGDTPLALAPAWGAAAPAGPRTVR